MALEDFFLGKKRLTATSVVVFILTLAIWYAAIMAVLYVTRPSAVLDPAGAVVLGQVARVAAIVLAVLVAATAFIAFLVAFTNSCEVECIEPCEPKRPLVRKCYKTVPVCEPEPPKWKSEPYCKPTPACDRPKFYAKAQC